MDVIILMAFHQQASLQFQLMQDVSHDLVAETATVSVWGVREWGAGWSGNCGSSSAWGGGVRLSAFDSSLCRPCRMHDYHMIIT